jgi:mannan endo-1,4-beta-mannosidase
VRGAEYSVVTNDIDMRVIKGIIFGVLFFLSAACAQQDPGFVRVEEGRFILEGKPYYYFGANFWHGAYLGADLVEGDRERLGRELDLLKDHEITNLRIMASSELSDLEMSVRPAFLDGSGRRNEELLRGLDYLLVEMGKRGMKAVLTLNNYWQWSGGMAQYVSWLQGVPVIDPDRSGDWHGFMMQSAEFYGDSAANAMYRAYIRDVVNRKNSLKGLLYRDDPTIMAWQLANEPRPAPDAASDSVKAKQYVSWVHETAAFIHSLDPNHLVSTGNEGLSGSVFSRQIFMDAHSSPDIDYMTFHIWPKNWGWYDATHPEATFDRSVKNTFEYFGQHIAMARELGKPAVLEEFGLERDGGSFSRESSTGYRDRYLSLLFSAVVDSAAAGSPMAGLNFWAWGGEATAAHEDFIWREGDSFMGDPPQEPQGLNSVFSSDVSTLEVFKKYNRALAELN